MRVVRTITLTAYKRPAYTVEVLRSLARCRRLSDFQRLSIFVDPGNTQVADVCRAFVSRLAISVDVNVNNKLLGVAENPLRAYTHVFDELGSEFNVAIEDDAVLRPDSLELALWYYAEHGAINSRYKFFNLCDHYNYRGAGRNKNNVPDDPSLIVESNHLSSPFAWCFTRHQWPLIKRNWNKNCRSIWGWDWSIRFVMRMEGWMSLAPVVSRCRNIGRADGTFETGATFWVQLGLQHSDGSYRGDYKIVNPISEDEARTLERWMIPEIPRYLAEHPRSIA